MRHRTQLLMCTRVYVSVSAVINPTIGTRFSCCSFLRNGAYTRSLYWFPLCICHRCGGASCCPRRRCTIYVLCCSFKVCVCVFACVLNIKLALSARECIANKDSAAAATREPPCVSVCVCVRFGCSVPLRFCVRRGASVRAFRS